MRRPLPYRPPKNLPAATIAKWERQHRGILERLQQDPTEVLAGEAQAVDWAMHEELMHSLGNDLIAEVYRVNAIKVRMAALIEALRDGRGEDAAAAMRRHIGNSLQLALGGEVD